MASTEPNITEDPWRRPNIPEDPWSTFGDYFQFKLGRDTPSAARNTLLVVAALNAAVTFQAGLNPPGGVWQEESTNVSHAVGKSILGSTSPTSYDIFLFASLLAFSASTSVIAWLVQGCPFHKEIMLAMGSMNFTYGAAIEAVTPPETLSWGYMCIPLMLPYVLRVLAEFIRGCKKKMGHA